MIQAFKSSDASAQQRASNEVLASLLVVDEDPISRSVLMGVVRAILGKTFAIKEALSTSQALDMLCNDMVEGKPLPAVVITEFAEFDRHGNPVPIPNLLGKEYPDLTFIVHTAVAIGPAMPQVKRGLEVLGWLPKPLSAEHAHRLCQLLAMRV